MHAYMHGLGFTTYSPRGIHRISTEGIYKEGRFKEKNSEGVSHIMVAWMHACLPSNKCGFCIFTINSAVESWYTSERELYAKSGEMYHN